MLKLSSVCKMKEIQFHPQWVLQTIRSVFLSHTHIEMLANIIHLQTAITVQQMLAREENS